MPDTPQEPCVCSQLRRTARLVSLFYDQALSATGLSVTQYALLARVGRTDGISRTALAAQLGMDRTTLTRNLRPLERDGLVADKPAEDRRAKLLGLTPAGRKKALAARPKWEQAQQRMLAHLGLEPWHQLQALLRQSEQIMEQAQDKENASKTISS